MWRRRGKGIKQPMPYVSTKIKKQYDKQKKTPTEAVQNTSAVEIANNRRSDIK